MNKYLKPLTLEQKQYARSIFPNVGYYKKDGEIWCHCCGKVEKELPDILAIDLADGIHQCECGNHIMLEYAPRKTHESEGRYYSVVQTCKGWQVIRTFYVTRTNVKYADTDYNIHEVYQNWISPEGKEYIMSKGYTRSFYHFSWYYGTEFRRRNHNASANGYIAYEDVFDVRHNFFYPKYNITRKLRKYGWCKGIEKLPYVSIAECMKLLLTSNNAETVVKQGQYDVFLYMVRNGMDKLRYMQSVNICHRHKYIITDAQIYFDMLSWMEVLDKDIRNPLLICPDNLYKAHDEILALYNKYQKKNEEELKRKEAIMNNDKYVCDKQKFFGVLITDGDISIEPLKSVMDFVEEAENMHHCVFSNEYYKKKESLILSAKVDGKREETIEVNLETFSVVQSRAAFNKNSEYHNRILDLMNRNMYMIKQCV